MRIFLAGGPGAVGRPLIAQAIARGHTVIATTRRPERLNALDALGAAPVVVNGLDGSAVHGAVKAAQPDAIVPQMTALAGPPSAHHCRGLCFGMEASTGRRVGADDRHVEEAHDADRWRWHRRDVMDPRR
jgi:putative NADH-flavin reductase